MVNHKIKFKLLIIFILSSMHLNIFTKQNIPASSESQDAHEIDEITQFLSESEVDEIDNNPDKLYVYLNPDVINCFNEIDLSKASDILKSMKQHICRNKSASHEFATEAVNSAIEYYKNLGKSKRFINTLKNYKLKLETGEAVIISEHDVVRRKKRTYNCVVVRRSLRTCSLYVRRNARICGNLCVKKNLGVNGNAKILNNLTASNINAGSISINGTPVVVSALGPTNNVRSLESQTRAIKPTRSGTLNGMATLSFANNFTIENEGDLFGSFTVTPVEQYITITPSNTGIITGDNLTENDPLLQALLSIRITCNNDEDPIRTPQDVYLLGVNLSFNVEIDATLFDPSYLPEVLIGLVNLPAAKNMSIYQLNPSLANNSQLSEFQANQADACYTCSSIQFCPSGTQFRDIENITRAYTPKLAAVRSITPVVTNVMLNSSGTLTFTVNLLVLIYDTENVVDSTELPKLANIIRQFFQNSSVAFIVNGVVNEQNSNFTPGTPC